nr:hypothetical protein [Tanacetum cinerariifolium]
MMMKRIGELEHIMANLIQENKKLEQRLDSHGKKKSRELPKTPPGSPPHQPPPPSPPARPSGASGSPGASGSSQVPPPPPPPPSTNQENLQMDEDMDLDEQAQSSDDEDIGSAHIPKASALASNYSPPPEDSLLAQTGDIAMFMDWFCKRRGITELKTQDLEGPAFKIIKVFHPDKEDFDSEFETDVVDSSSDEVGRKQKKLNIKVGLKRKWSGSDSSDSSSIDTAKVTRQKIHDMLGVPVGGYSMFVLDERKADHEFVKLWVGQFHPVQLRDLRVNDIARKYIYDCIRDSKLPSGTNHYLGPLTFHILLYLDSTKFDRFPVVRTRLAIKNWSTYLMKQRQELELKHHVLGILDLHVEWTEAKDLFKRAEEKLATICSERVLLENLMRKASSDYPGDGKFVELQKKYVQVFRDPISFDVDVDAGNDDNGDDDGDDGNDNDSDGNRDEEDVNEGDKDPNGSNPSFGFSKISLDDFHNDSGPTGIESVDPTEQETIVVGDLFVDNSETRELMNQGLSTHDQIPTKKASPSPIKRAIKPSCYLLSTYMNKKTNVVPKSTRLEFIVGNNMFAMQGLWLDANVVDCWGAVLNHEDRSRSAESKSRHFFPTGCISKSMFDGTLDTFDAKWKSFSNQVNTQFKGNKGGLAFEGIDLSYQNNSDDYT